MFPYEVLNPILRRTVLTRKHAGDDLVLTSIEVVLLYLGKAKAPRGPEQRASQSNTIEVDAGPKSCCTRGEYTQPIFPCYKNYECIG